MLNRYHLKITGRVQFVGFRYFVLMAATQLKLTGWVKNCYDEDNVEIEIQGENDIIDKFIKALYKGNGFSRIDNLESHKISCKASEKKFRVLF